MEVKQMEPIYQGNYYRKYMSLMVMLMHLEL